MSNIKLLSRLIRSHGYKLRKTSSLDPYRPILSMSVGEEHLKRDRTMATDTRCLNLDDLNPNIKIMEYAVRGPLVIRAGELEKELEKVFQLFFFKTNNRIKLIARSLVIIIAVSLQ